jgi:hypothetical protein
MHNSIPRAICPGFVKRPRRALVHDRVDHCLGHGGDSDLAAMRALAELS